MIESNSADILASADRTAISALLGNVTEVEPADTERKFFLRIDEAGVCSITQDGKQMVSGEPDHKFWKYFDSLVRILVAEWTRSLVFIHAGAVGWRGKAIVFPGNSFFGKTTLVAELVRRGAAYLSDEYAILDENGVVHPFAVI